MRFLRSDFPTMQRAWLILTSLLITTCVSCDSRRIETAVTRPGEARKGVSEIAMPQDDKIASGQTLYVPVYSYVFTADDAHPLDLAATLYVRNSDRSQPIVLTKVAYFDSSGKLIRDFLMKPLKIEPIASIDFFIKESDVTGGASPTFLVEWVSEHSVTNPVVESVMIGTAGTQGIAFICQGRVIATR